MFYLLISRLQLFFLRSQLVLLRDNQRLQSFSIEDV
jgi:hypothetical protein